MLVTPLQMAMVAGAIGVRAGSWSPTRRQDRGARWEGLGQAAADADPAGGEPGHGRCRGSHDAARRRARNGDRCPDLGLLGRRQDGYRRDRRPGSNTTWFIAFAGRDEESPAELAIAVVLQNQSGTGGTTSSDRPRGHAGNPVANGESLTSTAHGDAEHPHRNALRRPLPRHAEARRRRHGGRASPRTRSSGGASPSRSCTGGTRTTSSSSSASGVRRRTQPASHPNIVSIFDRGETDGSYFIVMEYVEGRTLKELIRSRGPCGPPVAIAYTRRSSPGSGTRTETA